MANEEGKGSGEGGAAGGGAGAEGGGAAGAGGTPAAGAGAGGAGAPAGGAAPAAAAGGQGGGGQKRPVITIPEAEFRKRVRRDAEKLVSEQLGVGLEEAKKIIADREKAATAAAAAAASGGTPAASAATTGKSKAEERQEREIKRLKDVVERKKRRLQSVRAKARDEVFEERMRGKALVAGVLAEETDYVLDLLRRTCATVPEGQPLPEPEAFFTGLRAKRPHLFAGAATPKPTTTVPVAGATAAPESATPGGGTPDAKTKVTPPADKSVDDMTEEEFKEYRGRKYQFTGS